MHIDYTWLYRKAWGSNQPANTPQTDASIKKFTARAGNHFQSPFSAIHGMSRSRTPTSLKADHLTADNSGSANPGPLDDILGQVTELLTQVNDILGR